MFQLRVLLGFLGGPAAAAAGLNFCAPPGARWKLIKLAGASLRKSVAQGLEIFCAVAVDVAIAIAFAGWFPVTQTPKSRPKSPKNCRKWPL